MVKKNFLKSSLIVLAVLAIALIPTASVKAVIDRDDDPALAYSAHVQNVGWTLASKASTVESDFAKSLAGSEGKAQRLEALKVTFSAPTGVTLSCNVHVQTKGWMGWTTLEGKDALVGTEGQSKRLEAIKFSVTGLEGYEIKYRAHVQTYGWQDWVTADDSQDVTKNFAGTKGESKRIEAIEVLILKTSDAELFDAHQVAIKTLKEFVANRGTYTFNAKKVEKRLNDWIDLLNNQTTVVNTNQQIYLAEGEFNGILTDEEIYRNEENVKSEIDKYVQNALDKEIQGKTENGTFAEVASIKQAIADAKANLLTNPDKEEYVTDDFEISSSKDTLFKIAKDKIDLAVAEYGLEKVNELYANVVTDLTDKVLSEDKYNQALTTLKVKDGEIDEENIPTSSVVVNLINNTLKPDVLLGDVINYRKTELNTFVETNYNRNFASEFSAVSGVLADKSVTHLKEISYIKDAIEAGKSMIDEARSAKAAVDALESAKAGTVTALRGFINRTISELTTMGNDSNKILKAEAVTAMRNAMNKNYETVTEEAKSLEDAFHTMLHERNFEEI